MVPKTNSLSYAGIGSRQTPPEFMKFFEDVGEYLGSLGWILRSGGADGADAAFETGCDRAAGKKEIYLPWPGFNGNNSEFKKPAAGSFEVSRKYHPRWHSMKESVQCLHARNAHQVLGWDLESKSKFVICWADVYKGSGTTQAIRIANAYKIPVYNYFLGSWEIDEILKQV
jgi:hypothetical protein